MSSEPCTQENLLPPAAFSTIYWPIETKVRELDAALLMAAVAARRGWSVIIGGKTELYRRLKQNAEPGIFIDKSIQKRSEELFTVLKRKGHRVYARCEEGLWFATPVDYCNRKTGPGAIREVEGFLAWGQEHARAVSEVYPEHAHKVFATGNVRSDLMTPSVRGFYAADVSRIKQEWGDFYLLNTKFAKINFIKRGPAGGFVEAHIAKGHAPNEEQVRLTTNSVAKEKAVLPHFIEFVRRFATELPGEKLIIRPHPAEDFALWQGLAADKPNIHVVHQGPVQPWLLASKISISSDCTTSLEAYLLDKPGINFRPYKDDEVEWIVPTVAAYQIDSTDDLLRALASADPRSMLSMPDVPTAEIVGRYVAQSGGNLAANAILDHFADVHVARERGNGAADSPLGTPSPLFVAQQRLKVFVAWCMSKDNRARHRNRAHKFRGLDQAEIEARLDTICRTLQYDGIRVRKVADNIFHVDQGR